MTDLFTTTGVRDDPDHWDTSAARIAEAATRTVQGNEWAWFASSRGAWLAASILLIIAAFSVRSATENPPFSDPNGVLRRALVPSEDTATALVLRSVPPSIETLLLGRRAGGG